MINPREVTKFIERSEVGYTLGNAIKSIIRGTVNLTKEENLQHLKDARLFLNDEIKRLSRKEKIK